MNAPFEPSFIGQLKGTALMLGAPALWVWLRLHYPRRRPPSRPVFRDSSNLVRVIPPGDKP